MKNRGLIVVGLVVAVAALIAAYAVSPWIALASLKSAAKGGDRDKLEQLIDFPRVRESLKDQINAQMMVKLSTDPDLKNNPFAGLAAVMVPTLVDRGVDSLMTPDAISQLLERGQSTDTQHAQRAGQSASSAAPVSAARAPAGEALVKSEYTKLDTFTVRSKNPENPAQDALRFVLRRQGLFGWRLVRIEIPKGMFD